MNQMIIKAPKEKPSTMSLLISLAIQRMRRPTTSETEKRRGRSGCRPRHQCPIFEKATQVKFRPLWPPRLKVCHHALLQNCVTHSELPRERFLVSFDAGGGTICLAVAAKTHPAPSSLTKPRMRACSLNRKHSIAIRSTRIQAGSCNSPTCGS